VLFSELPGSALEYEAKTNEQENASEYHKGKELRIEMRAQELVIEFLPERIGRGNCTVSQESHGQNGEHHQQRPCLGRSHADNVLLMQ
jgi:hypothetical protein